MSSQNLLGSILLAVAAFAFFGFILPVYDEVRATQTAIDDRTASITELQQALQSVESLKSEMQGRIEEVEKLGGVISEGKRADEVLSSINAIANESGMQVVQFSMGDVGLSSGISTGSIDMNLRGAYGSFMTFLENMENNLRLFDVQGISIATPDQTNVLNINLKINVYYLQ